jgi:hypothetical protein
MYLTNKKDEIFYNYFHSFHFIFVNDRRIIKNHTTDTRIFPKQLLLLPSLHTIYPVSRLWNQQFIASGSASEADYMTQHSSYLIPYLFFPSSQPKEMMVEA